MRKIIIPPKSYFKRAYNLLFNTDIRLREKRYDYYHINEKIHDTPEFNGLVEKYINRKIVKISSGTSDRLAYKGFLREITKNLTKDVYYRNYNNPLGSVEARKALAIKENMKFSADVYSYSNFVLAEGTTGAITSIFEYIKRTYSDGEVIISGPTYYLYKFAAQYFKLSFKEVMKLQKKDGAYSFTSIEEVIRKITNKTKLIILVQPNNPTGEVYSESSIKRLLKTAKEKGILVLADELFFELIFNKINLKSTDLIAANSGALDNIVIVKGFSKTKNLPGLRIGYLFSTNVKLIDGVEEISELRQCFAGASNFADVIVLDSFIQSVDLNEKKEKLKRQVEDLKAKFKFSKVIQSKTINELIELTQECQKYDQQILNFYSKNYDDAQKILKDDVEYFMPKTAAFNTFVKLIGIDGTNFFDFCFNFYLTCGVETQIAPCYIYDQNIWQKEKNLGFWIRITFARDRRKFLRGIRLLSEFKKIYVANQTRFLKTDMKF